MTLQDGSTVTLRALQPQERAAVLDVFSRLGDESRRRRFFGAKPRLSDRDLDRLTDVDVRNRDALVAVVSYDEHAESVGVARFVRDPDDPETAEVAFAVADDWQSRGIGTQLAGALARRARAVGIRRLRASVFADNARSLSLVRRVGRVVETRRDGPTVELVVEL
jgi:RimJ/RimL family protein N-acetyltransferase